MLLEACSVFGSHLSKGAVCLWSSVDAAHLDSRGCQWCGPTSTFSRAVARICVIIKRVNLEPPLALFLPGYWPVFEINLHRESQICRGVLAGTAYFNLALVHIYCILKSRRAVQQQQINFWLYLRDDSTAEV